MKPGPSSIFMAAAGALLLLSLLAAPAQAQTQAQGMSPAERRALQLAQELRCLVCQNQTLADSHAPLAMDLKAQLRQQIQAGQTDAQILHYMSERYGDFVLYRPPVQANTWLLWAGPGLLMAAALSGLALNLRRRAQQQDTAFEPEPEHEEPEA